MTAVEVLPEFDEARARQTLALVEEAMTGWVSSTVHLADLVYATNRDQCWRVDDDFRAGLATSAIALAANGNHQQTWLSWKFNRATRTVRDLADYGELRAIIGADPELPQLAEPEGAARPLAALLRPKYTRSEVVDVDEHHDAVRAVWRDALARAEGDPAVAVREAIKVAKRSEFAPIRRAFNKTRTQKLAERETLCIKSVKAMRDGGYKLLELGDLERFDAAIAELVEARRRWKA